MNQHPAVYWRQQQLEKKLLNQTGKILTLTKNPESNDWIGLIQLKNEKVTKPIISSCVEPKIGDKVIGVLRIFTKNGVQGLIQYGVKFQLKAEVF